LFVLAIGQGREVGQNTGNVRVTPRNVFPRQFDVGLDVGLDVENESVFGNAGISRVIGSHECTLTVQENSEWLTNQNRVRNRNPVQRQRRRGESRPDRRIRANKTSSRCARVD